MIRESRRQKKVTQHLLSNKIVYLPLREEIVDTLPRFPDNFGITTVVRAQSDQANLVENVS